jgi:hypothetical protein
MAIDLTLGGARRPWRLRGEHAVEAWAQGRPWLGAGGTLSLTIGGQVDALRNWVRRTLWAWDAGASSVRFVDMSVVDRQDLAGGLRRWLGVGRTDLHAMAKGLGADLEHRPAVFLLSVPDAVAAAGVVDLTEELRDWIVKLDFARGPAFVILIGGNIGLARGSVACDLGWPHGITDDLFEDVTPEERWSLYVHLRIAYETAGRIDDALSCDRSGVGRARCDDDAACERALNAHAAQRLSALDPTEAEAWRARARSGHWHGVPPLPFKGLPWISPSRATPAPWLARALLLVPGAVASRRLLRAEIVCHPLAEALLKVCFAVEAAQRARIGHSPSEAPDDQAVSQYDRFVSGRSSAARDLYPVGHPAPPSDAWDFASVGAIQRLVYGPHELAHLRNALAHGHYAGWAALSRVSALRRRSGL